MTATKTAPSAPPMNAPAASAPATDPPAPTLEEAAATVEALRERIANGEDVTQKEFKQANENLEFALLVHEGKKRKIVVEQKQFRIDLLNEIKQRAKTELDPAQFEAPRAALEKALDEFMAVCREYDDKHTDVFEPVIYGQVKPGEGVILDTGSRIYVSNVEVRRARPQNWCSQLVFEAFRRYYPGSQFDLGRPQD